MLAGPQAVCDDYSNVTPSLILHKPSPGCHVLRPWEVVHGEILQHRTDPPLYVSLIGASSSANHLYADEVRACCAIFKLKENRGVVRLARTESL